MDNIEFDNIYIKAIDERNEWEFRLTAHLMLIMGSVFAIMISLNNGVFDNYYSLVFFQTSMFLCSLNILSGTLSLYRHVKVGRKTVHTLHYNRSHLHKKDVYGENGEMLITKKSKFFSVCEWICWLSFLLAVVSLTLYTIFKVKY